MAPRGHATHRSQHGASRPRYASVATWRLAATLRIGAKSLVGARVCWPMLSTVMGNPSEAPEPRAGRERAPRAERGRRRRGPRRPAASTGTAPDGAAAPTPGSAPDGTHRVDAADIARLVARLPELTLRDRQRIGRRIEGV